MCPHGIRHATSHSNMQAIPAPLLFFMTSEMTEKFFTIAPTNTFRKMNAPASGGAAIVSVRTPSSGTAPSFVTGKLDRSATAMLMEGPATPCLAEEHCDPDHATVQCIRQPAPQPDGIDWRGGT